MCIKPFLPNQVLQDIIQIYYASLGEVTGHPIGLVSTGKGMFLEEIKSNSCKMGEVDNRCPEKGCIERREMQGFPVGAFVEGELHLSWMKMFPIPFMILFLFFISFSSRS
jgi:hypothetical protein